MEDFTELEGVSLQLNDPLPNGTVMVVVTGEQVVAYNTSYPISLPIAI